MPERYLPEEGSSKVFEFIQKLQETTGSVPQSEDLIILLNRQSVFIRDGVLPCRGGIANLPENSMEFMLLGEIDGQRCFAAEISGNEIPDGDLQEIPIRQFLFEFPESFQQALCRARVLLSWRKDHRFCGVCRAGLEPSAGDAGLVCPDCGKIYYPQLSPAVIIGITRKGGRELLLAHNRRFAGNMYSLIAGFVEAGESLEAAVHREVWEECSIRVKNLRYVTSQVWPFPNSLMLAFTAEYESGTACADGEELSDLGWFTAENHPELPSPGSVARQLIDSIFVNQ